jgi:hypothetical protein
MAIAEAAETNNKNMSINLSSTLVRLFSLKYPIKNLDLEDD